MSGRVYVRSGRAWVDESERSISIVWGFVAMQASWTRVDDQALAGLPGANSPARVRLCRYQAEAPTALAASNFSGSNGAKVDSELLMCSVAVHLSA